MNPHENRLPVHTIEDTEWVLLSSVSDLLDLGLCRSLWCPQMPAWDTVPNIALPMCFHTDLYCPDPGHPLPVCDDAWTQERLTTSASPICKDSLVEPF